MKITVTYDGGLHKIERVLSGNISDQNVSEFFDYVSSDIRQDLENLNHELIKRIDEAFDKLKEEPS